MERHYPRRGQDGERSLEQRGAQNYRDLRRKLWGWPLRDVRKGLRSAVHFCLADGALCRDERRFRRRDAGGNQGEATGAQREKAERRGTARNAGIDPEYI